jgi:hypothetical protein
MGAARHAEGHAGHPAGGPKSDEDDDMTPEAPVTVPGWRGQLRDFIEKPLTQRVILVLILVNAVILGLETSPSLMASHGPLPRPPQVGRVIGIPRRPAGAGPVEAGPAEAGPAEAGP